MPWWQGGGGVSNICFANIHVLLSRPASYIKSSHKSKNKMFRPHLSTFIDAWEVPDENKRESWHKTVVICSQIFYRNPQRHLVAISASSRRRGRPVDWVSDSSKNSLILRLPICFCIFFLYEKLKFIIFKYCHLYLFSDNSIGRLLCKKGIWNL